MSKKILGDLFAVPPVKRVSLVVLAILFLFSVTAFAAASPVYDFVVVDGEKTTSVPAEQPDVDEILLRAGVVLFDGDAVDTDGLTPTGGTIIINRGVKVTVVAVNGEEKVINFYGTVAGALLKAGVTVTPDNKLNYKLDTPVKDEMVIQVYNRYGITVVCDGKEKNITVAGRTVADVLNAAGIKLGEDDVVEPSLNTKLSDGMSIEVYRVTKKMVTETVSIPYKTITKKSASMYIYQTKVQTAGRDGEKRVTSECIYINGEFLVKSPVKSIVLSDPVNKVVVKGTKTVTSVSSNFRITATNTISEMAVPSDVVIGDNGLPVNYRKSIRAKATAYCMPGCTTSTGKRAQTGYIAVDPREIPYGTEMYIVSADGRYVYGYCIAADTGGFIYDHDWTVDLYMNSERQCINWGRRDIVIYFL